MAQEGSSSSTVTETIKLQENNGQNQPEQVVLHLQPEEAPPRVRWAQDTVDNEFMGKKKSKCCCIYKKQKKWNESSDEEDSDCETGHCRGHVEKKGQTNEQ